MDKDKLLNVLKNGGIAIIPTDTTYGIVCDALNEEAVKKVYYAKKRDFNKPLIILVSDIEMLKKYTKDLNDLEIKIIEKYMPNKLSMLLKKNDLISDLVIASSNLVGIRIPDSKELRDFISILNSPIVASSANISGSDIVTNLDNLEEELKSKIDYIYNGGIIDSVASTIIKVENNKIKFIREGILTNQIKEDFKDYI